MNTDRIFRVLCVAVHACVYICCVFKSFEHTVINLNRGEGGNRFVAGALRV